MKLQEKLDGIKAELQASIPPEAVAVMQRAAEELRASKILDKALKTGDKAPGFSLPNANGEIVSSKELLTKGPLVVSFYRGMW